MGFPDLMRTLCNIDCIAQSADTYLTQKKEGKSTAAAGVNLFANLANGFVRNDIAYDMQRHGNSWGNFINTSVGYGNAEANATGSLALMSACMPSPRMWFCGGGVNYFSCSYPSTFATPPYMQSCCSPYAGFGGGFWC